jgi:tripartite-type tricarboxylate transporter receptor subunit TctC
MFHRVATLFLWMMILSAGSGAYADAYPKRTVRIIVPAAPGGIADFVGRLFGDYLKRTTRQNVVIENQAGAGGNAAFEAVARSAPDGYTLGLATTGHIVVNHYLFKNLQFNPELDLTPIAPIGHAPILFFVSTKLHANSFADFVAFAKLRPNTITYGSPGVGTTLHLATDQIARLTQIKLVHVPYRGAAPALTDLIAGHIDALSISIALPLPFVREGKIRPIVAATKMRLRELPEVPTSAEVGVPDFETTTWFALFARKGTPDGIVKFLNGAASSMLNESETQKRLADQYVIPLRMSVAEFSEFLRQEDAKWRRLVQESGVIVD